MIHSGNAITVQMLSDGIAELRFDLQGESVNKFNRATVEDLKAATDAIKAHSDITPSKIIWILNLLWLRVSVLPVRVWFRYKLQCSHARKVKVTTKHSKQAPSIRC